MNDHTRSASIYGLFDLSDPYRRIRYVGQTTLTPELRLAAHVAASRAQQHQNLDAPVYRNWMSQLNRADVGVILLENCNDSDRLERERYWIDLLKTREHLGGFNTSRGIELDEPPTEEELVQVKKARLAKTRMTMAKPEVKARKSATSLSNWQNPAFRAKQALANHNRWHVRRGLEKSGCEYCASAAKTDTVTS